MEPSLEDIASIFEAYELDKESVLYLHKLALQRGGIRNCVKVLNIALQLRASEKEPLNIEHLQAAYRLRNGEQ